MKMAIFIADKARQESGTGQWERAGGGGGGLAAATHGILNIYANWQPGA